MTCEGRVPHDFEMHGREAEYRVDEDSGRNAVPSDVLQEQWITQLPYERRGGGREMVRRSEAERGWAGAEKCRGTRGDGKALLSPGKQM